jgi:hypothetical protein
MPNFLAILGSNLSSGRLRLAVLIAFIGGLAIAGIAYASIPDSNGVIHGCYAKRGGGLRVIDTGAGQSCNAKETPLSWNQSGPTGAIGPAGPSDAYTVEGTRVIPGDGATYTVASMSLPQGSFVVVAVVRLTLGGTSTSSFITCVTLSDGAPILDGSSVVTLDAAHSSGLPTLGRAIIRTGTSTVTLACRSNQSSVSIDAFMVATKIGTIHDEQ